jgi:molybdate transport system substrate-binding protein
MGIRRLFGLLAACLAVSTTACGGDDIDTLTVMVASSMSGVFADLESAFEATHPNVNVVVVTGSSSSLAGQIVEGADVDVFASADVEQFERAASAVAFDAPVFVASNTLVIIVPPGNPRDVRSLRDLARDDVLVATADESVPIRAYSEQVLERAGVVANFVSFEANVSGIVTKVATGEADAGIVYATDSIGANVETIDIPTDINVVTTSPIAARVESDRASLAREFVAFAGERDDLFLARGFGAT